MPTELDGTHPTDAAGSPVYRVEVCPGEGQRDPIGDALRHDAGALGVALTAARASHVYLIGGQLTGAQLERVVAELLTDPVTERAVVGASPARPGEQVVEVHPLPGVMDPVAQSVRDAVRELTGAEAQVSTGWRYDLAGISSTEADLLASRLLANPVVHRVVREPWHPAAFPRGRVHGHAVRRLPLRGMDDGALTVFSREAHLFLSLEEMRAVRAEYERLGRDPTEAELETLAQTWSEHCVHKTLKSRIRYRASAAGATDPIRWTGRPGHTVEPDGTIVIDNLLRSTVARATHALIADGVDWTLSVFVDNSGVIALDEAHAVCIKVETHNHPSAIEPYGGAATGIGGCIRDVIGTGLGAAPIASTDVFCVAHPDGWSEPGSGPGGDGRALPAGCLPPRRVLRQVVAGVRDYGNRMGIPTVAGAVAFDDRYVGNPLVFCGCVGLLPRSAVRGRVREGDRIIALGGRTGRDGIHGATFSSAELTETHADEFAHAVQIGNAIEEKRVLDAILRARDEDPGGPLFHALTDCGAGGFSSAVGEMGRELGAEVELSNAPLKYEGLSPTEIWISEAQERMVLAVPERNVGRLRGICAEEGVEAADLGRFGTPGRELVLRYHGEEVGRLDMGFLHDGIPQPLREAEWPPPPPAAGDRPAVAARLRRPASPPGPALLALLGHPTIASKHWIIRQYDHEVRGATVLKPLVGPQGRGPGDASVVEPVPGTGRGIALGCGLQTGIGDPRHGGDPYLMALAAIDECVRNLVCVGADPARIAILDNFCWPSCGRAHNLGALVRACEGCLDGALAYRTPFVSGKDSLNNQFTTQDGRTIEIPYTLLITGLGIVPAIAAGVTSDAKQAGNRLVLIGPGPGAGQEGLGGSVYAEMFDTGGAARARVPRVDLALGPRCAGVVGGLVRAGVARSAHDVSDGGLLVAVAEMLIGGSGVGARVDAGAAGAGLPAEEMLFGEAPSRYVLEVEAGAVERVRGAARDAGVHAVVVGELHEGGVLALEGVGGGMRVPVVALRDAWRAPLDW